MEETVVVKNKKGLIFCIISLVFILCAIICCAYFAFMIKEHFELQSSAEGWEGLGSIGLVLLGVIFAGSSIIATLISSLFSVITIIKSTNKLKLIGIILLVLNVVILITNIVLFIVLKLG